MEETFTIFLQCASHKNITPVDMRILRMNLIKCLSVSLLVHLAVYLLIVQNDVKTITSHLHIFYFYFDILHFFRRLQLKQHKMSRQCRNLIFLNNYKVESSLNETSLYGMDDDSEE